MLSEKQKIRLYIIASFVVGLNLPAGRFGVEKPGKYNYNRGVGDDFPLYGFIVDSRNV